MLQCWALKPDHRPSFSHLVDSLSCSLEGMAGYVHIGAFGTRFNVSNSPETSKPKASVVLELSLISSDIQESI